MDNKVDVPVPPYNSAGQVQAKEQDGTIKQPVVNGGDPVKDAMSNDVDKRKDEAKKLSDEKDHQKKLDDAVGQKSALPEGKEAKHSSLVAKLPVSAKPGDAPNAPHQQSGSVGTLLGNMQGESGDVHKKIENILRDHDGKENNIPIGNEYWGLLNQYRLLRGQGK